jgi:hypothetical protein
MVDLNKPGLRIAITQTERIRPRYYIMTRENAPFSEMASLFHTNRRS